MLSFIGPDKKFKGVAAAQRSQLVAFFCSVHALLENIAGHLSLLMSAFASAAAREHSWAPVAFNVCLLQVAQVAAGECDPYSQPLCSFEHAAWDSIGIFHQPREGDNTQICI